METLRLTHREIKPLREQLLSEQGHLCALCSEPIEGDAVLDHDHDSGLIRCVLHRGCNALLGKIENNMARNRVNIGRLSNISKNLITYLTADPSTDLLHPTYKTQEERAMYKKKKGKKKPGKKY
jgi:hypothetical protein